MKSIRVAEYGPPSVLRLEEVPDPRPGKGEVLVRVRAAGVNPVETYLRAGTHYRLSSFPWTPGTDGAGVVEDLGEGVDSVKPGDRVYTAGSLSGTYAEKVLCRASQVHPLPSQVSFPQGAAVHVPYATAWRALFHRARAEPGETVLVHGASGGVGLAAVQIARAHGMVVVGTAGSPRGLKAVTENGAHHAINHREAGYLDDLPLRLGSTRGVDVVLEMLASVNLAIDLKVLALGGRVVVVGSRGTIEIDPRLAMGKDASILGMSLWNVPEKELASIHAALGAGLANGTLRPVIREEMPLADAARAHEEVLKPGALGKIVLVPPA